MLIIGEEFIIILIISHITAFVECLIVYYTLLQSFIISPTVYKLYVSVCRAIILIEYETSDHVIT